MNYSIAAAIIPNYILIYTVYIQVFYFIAFITITCYYFRAYKTIVEDDLKFPLIYGEGKKVSE